MSDFNQLDQLLYVISCFPSGIMINTLMEIHMELSKISAFHDSTSEMSEDEEDEVWEEFNQSLDYFLSNDFIVKHNNLVKMQSSMLINVI